MIGGVWGKKVGMTQVFSEKNKVVPVTVIDTAHWFITAIKTKAQDGYAAVQVGRVRQRYEGQPFAAEWLKAPRKYFVLLREIRHADDIAEIQVGQPAFAAAQLAVGQAVDAVGKTIGRGFQGVVKRHNFAGGVATHGSMFKRRPGTLSFMRSRGRVIKGKRLPGQMGQDRCMMKNLPIVRVEADASLVAIKGSVPGKAGSFIFLRKK